MNDPELQNERKRTCLEYLSLFIQNGDTSAHLFRTFVDDWFAYHAGGAFLNSRGKPRWFNNPDPEKCGAALRRCHFISRHAMDALEGNGAVRLVKDHALPLRVLKKALIASESTEPVEIQNFLSSHYRLGLISKQEDRCLNALGLRQELPADANGLDWMARYQAAAIPMARRS